MNRLFTFAESLEDWEPSSWNVEAKYVQRRRNLFWELYVMDIFKVRDVNTFPPVLVIFN